MPGITQALLDQDPQGVLTFLQNANTTSSAASYTFNGQNIGTASSDRYIIIAIAGGGASGNISSVTINGNAMTKENGNSANAQTFTGIYRLLVTTGTTANVVVNMSTTMAFCSISMFSLTSFGTLSAPYSSATSTTASANVCSLSLNNRAGGGVIFISSRFQSGTAPTVTAYSGCNVEDVNQVNNTTNRTWVGHLSPTGVALSRTFSVTYSGGTTNSTTGVAY